VPPHTSISLRSYWRLVRHNRNFRRLWIAQIVSETGDWFYMVALYAMLLEFTGRAEVLGIAFVLQVLPQALTGPFAGVINDHFSRKRVMVFTDVARFVIIGCVLFVRSPATVWLIYPLLFLETVMWGMFEPARNAVLPNIVAAEDVLVANTVASTTWSMNLFLGAALGGVAAVWLGRDATIVIDMLTFLVSAWMLSRMRFDEPHLAGLEGIRVREALNFAPIADGFRYIARQPRMLTTVLVKAGVGLTGASWVIFPILGKMVFPVWRPGFTAEKAALAGMSALMVARGVGSAFGPLAMGSWAQQRPRRLRIGICLGFLLSATGYSSLAFTHSYPLAYAEVVLANAGGAIGWVFSTTLLQLMSDDRFRGRIFSAELACATVMMASTSFVAGFALDRGLTLSYVLLATGLLAGAALTLWAAVGLRRDAVRVQE
jgi:MFS family permease